MSTIGELGNFLAREGSASASTAQPLAHLAPANGEPIPAPR